MAAQKRRTQIQIEMHEITIIRFGKLHPFQPVEHSTDTADVIAHAEAELQPADTDGNEEENEYEKQS